MIRAGLALALIAAVPAASSASAPIAVAASGHLTVPVTVDGRGPFPFVLDTGAEGSAVYARFADEQHLRPRTTSELLVGQTGRGVTPLVRLAAVELDGHVARCVDAVRLEDRRDGVALAGIVGLDVLGDRIVDFDFARRRVSLGAAPPSRGRPLHARAVTGGLLAIEVAVNGVRGVAVIDTGARETRVNRRYAAAAGIAPETAGGTVVHGATGQPQRLASGRVRSAEFGSVRRTDLPVRIADLPVFAEFGLADEPAMLLGADWLAGQRMVIDFPRRLVWIGG